MPSEEAIKKLHKKYAADDLIFEDVWTHCKIVRDIAVAICQKYPNADHELVNVGALVHDIGVYELYADGKIDRKNYITHGLKGYDILKNEGFDEKICRFALLHTGVGVSRQDVIKQKLPLPSRDYIAETLEERIVMFADKFHSKGEINTFNSSKWYSHYLEEKFGNYKADIFKSLIEEFGEPDLIELSKKYNHPIR